MSWSCEVAGKTDLGCVRTNNEDNFGYDARCGIFVVCDGMGGAAAGEVASKIGVDTMLDYFRRAANGTLPRVSANIFPNVSERARALGAAILKANSEVHMASNAAREHAGMGSTIVAVYLKGNFISIGHVGDSRIYLVRGGAMEQLTNDHSFVMEQVRRGIISLEEAEHAANQNIILRALGSEETVEPDLDDMVGVSGDVLLLATDGLTKLVKDPKMLEIIGKAPSLKAACDNLIAAARERGGDDNITCILVRLVKEPWYRRWFGKAAMPSQDAADSGKPQ